jgi:hypothetical protein
MGFADPAYEKERLQKVLADCGKCPRCRPHRGENVRQSKRGTHNDRYKDHRS